MEYRALLLAGVIATLPVGYLACVSDSTQGGADAGVEAGGDDAMMAGDTGADTFIPPQGCPLGCLPPAPSGWTGPSAVYDGPPGTKPAACPPIYLQKELEAHQGLMAGAAVCACGTATFQGASCSAKVETWTGQGCTGQAILEGTFTIPGSCLQTSTAGYTFVDTPSINRGTCSFPSPTKNLPTPTMTALNVSCGLPQNATCAMNAQCVATPIPDAPYTRLCIHQDGDIACPSADYSKRFVAYKNVMDTRDCSPCSGTTTGGSCGSKWGTSNTVQNCNNSLPSSFFTNGCDSNSFHNSGIAVGGPIDPKGINCDPDGGAPQGEAKSANPVTFCCNK